MYRRTGFIKRNKAFLLLFVNVIAIVAVYNLGIRFLVPDDSVRKIGAYTLKLKAYLFEDQVLTTLRVVKTGEAGVPGEASVVFDIDPVPENGADSTERTIVLPVNAGDERSANIRLPFSGTQKKVTARVLIAGESLNLSAGISRE